jgi:hypothetical protein
MFVPVYPKFTTSIYDGGAGAMAGKSDILACHHILLLLLTQK